MDAILPLIQPPLVLIKDFSSRADWNTLETVISNESFSCDGNYNITQSKHILDNCVELSVDIISECKAFVENVCPMQFEFDLKITDSWVNAMQQGDCHPWHSHPFSVVSGVLFLDDHPENGNLTFKNAIGHSIPPYSLLDVDFYTPLNNLLDNKTPVLKHHLVLFYSNILHSVPALETANLPRRTLSFNTFWKGRVNFGAELNSYTFA